MKRFIIEHDINTEVTNNGDMINAPTQWRFDGNNITISDGYHTMHELYQHRMALNIALFHAWHQLGLHVKVMKSKLHSDGTMFENYFIVMAITPQGQISYHYDLKHWDKFKIPEVDRTPPYDGHGSQQVMERLVKL